MLKTFQNYRTVFELVKISIATTASNSWVYLAISKQGVLQCTKMINYNNECSLYALVIFETRDCWSGQILLAWRLSHNTTKPSDGLCMYVCQWISKWRFNYASLRSSSTWSKQHYVCCCHNGILMLPCWLMDSTHVWRQI